MQPTFITRLWGCAALAAGFVLFTLPAVAAADNGKPKLEIAISAEKEVTVTRGGKETTKRIPAVDTHKGDILVYTVRYSNKGDAPAVNAAIVDPLPQGTVYLLDSAGGKDATVTVSVDGGHQFQPPPAKIKLTRPDGSVVEETALADQHSHVRWLITRPVPPGGSGTLWFKVVVQ
jgi:uncharacterized repeat protein (TIGR01451 family)